MPYVLIDHVTSIVHEYNNGLINLRVKFIIHSSLDDISKIIRRPTSHNKQIYRAFTKFLNSQEYL